MLNLSRTKTQAKQVINYCKISVRLALIVLSLGNAISNIFLSVSQRSFAQHTLISTLNPERNQNLRVMSTPTWPVPYWQRSYRHDPTPLEMNEIDLSCQLSPITDGNVIQAKENLKMNGQGFVVEAVENHLKISHYITNFKDSGDFCTAYVEDLLDCLTLVSKQNKRIMDEIDLADALK